MNIIAVNEFEISYETNEGKTESRTYRSEKSANEFKKDVEMNKGNYESFGINPNSIKVKETKVNMFCVQASVQQQSQNHQHESLPYYTINELIKHHRESGSSIDIPGFGPLNDQTMDTFKSKYNRVMANFLDPTSHEV